MPQWFLTKVQENYNGRNRASSTNGSGMLGHQWEKNEHWLKSSTLQLNHGPELKCKILNYKTFRKKKKPKNKKQSLQWGTWVAQLVKHMTLAQVMISQSMSLSPRSGSVLTAQILDPSLDSGSPSLSALLPLALCLSLSKKRIKTF